MKRLVGSTAIALVALTGCTSGNKDATPPGPSPSASSRASATSGTCTLATARSRPQVLVSSSGFDTTCVKAAVGKQFFFVNNGDKAQSLKTSEGAPESFQVDLPKKTSTYARAFKKKGTYVIEQAGGKTPLTLVVR